MLNPTVRQTIVPVPAIILLLLVIPWAVSADPYEDPRRGYRVEVPAGWKVRQLGEDVRLERGGAGVLISMSEGEAPGDLVSRVAEQVGSQWSKFQELKRGSVTVGGQPAPFGLYSGVNPKGVASFLKVTAVPGGRQVFALIATIPEPDLAALKPVLDRIEQSFVVRAAPPAPRDSGPRGEPPAGPAFLGAGLRDLEPDDELPPNAAGAFVGVVAPGGPAERAGIEPGDIVTHVDGRPVARAADLPRAVAARRPGDVLELTVLREGRATRVRVTLEPRP